MRVRVKDKHLVSGAVRHSRQRAPWWLRVGRWLKATPRERRIAKHKRGRERHQATPGRLPGAQHERKGD